MALRSVAFLSFALCVSVSAQAPRPSFEVAAVRPTDTTKPRTSNGGIRVTGQQFSAAWMSMKQLMELAYGIRPDRMEGLGWSPAISAAMFDIEAKMPEGTRPSQVPAMMRGLLEERFKLSAHRGTKIGDFIALLVGKDGAKLTKLEPAADDFSRMDWISDGGFFQSGSTKSIERDGLMRVEMSTLADVATLLNPHFGGLPVVDKTGLQGSYDIKLQYAIPDAAKARAEGRMTTEFLADLRDQMKTGTIAGIEKLGLKVEKQHGEIETLVIDHLEKVPSEN